jgi:antitoxin component YwqK of YwqJK toxin-antitoxin module
MKLFLSIIFLTFLSSLVAQEYKFEYGEELYMDYHYNCLIDYGYTFKKKLPDGKYIAYSSQNSDLILVEALYKDRKKSGKWKVYNRYLGGYTYKNYAKGKLLSEKHIDSLGHLTWEAKNFKNQENVNYYSYYDNGDLKSSDENLRYKKKSTQRITERYQNGNIKSVIQYRNKRRYSIPIGKWLSYFENGQLRTENEYGKNWKEIGVWREWNKKGELINEINKESE